MSHPSPIQRALDELETELANLTARREKVAALIAGIRDTFHLPSTVPTRAARSKSVAPASNGHGRSQVSEKEIRDELKSGPLSPGVLAKRLGSERRRLRQHLKQLEARGIVRSYGKTADRVVALADGPKEAP